ncbi:MAG: hypothetical protein CMF55_01810 [Legionellales bacterium]|nr:hypothetical protein [Legionellales bacterium]
MNQPTLTNTPPWLFRFKQQHAICQRRMKTLYQKTFKQSSWTLILGPDKSGKSSLLNALQCQHISTQDESHETTPFDWWINHSEYFLVGDLQTVDQQAQKYQLWQDILPLLKTPWKRQALKRIILIIDLPTLCLSSTEELHSLYKKFHNHITKIQALSPRSRIHIAINHCDRIIGLKEYAQEQKASNVEQNLGISLHKKNQLMHFDTLFHKRRNDFIRGVNEEVVALCQLPMPMSKRKELLQLPFQLDALLLRIKQFINPLTDQLKKNIHSICFCASEQRHQPINTTTPYLKQIITPIHSNPIHTNESYIPLFLNKDNFADIHLSHKKTNLSQSLSLKPFPIAVTLALSLSITSTYYMALDHGYKITEATYHALQSIQQQTPDNTPSTKDLAWVDILKKDQEMLHTIKQSGALKYQWIGIHPIHQLYEQIHEHYTTTQQSDFIPYAYSLLIQSINQTSEASSRTLFQGLHVFLMMTGKHTIDEQRVITWYQEQWKKTNLPESTINILTEQLTAVLKHHQQAWPTNESLIQLTRQALLKQPISELALLKQESLILPHNVTIADTSSSILTKSSLTIPEFYTHTQKNTIEQLTGDDIAHTLNQNNWIITIPSQIIADTNKKQLLKDIQSLYSDQYQTTWRQLLSQLTFKTPKTLSELQLLTSEINNPKSSFYTILDLIQSQAQQTSLDITNQHPSSSDDPTPNWSKDLSNMSNQLSTILQNSNPNFMAFQHTTKSIKDKKQAPSLLALKSHYEDAPQLLQPALTLIIKNYWGVMLNASREFINTQWKKTIIPLYKTGIINRFPIFYPAKNDISTEDFNAFFGPQGAIDSFFNQYLAPFVNASGYYWTWIKIDGHTLSSSQHALDMIIRASVIQQMFYTNNQSKPSESFALAIKNHSTNINHVDISIDNNSTTIKANDSTVHKFTSMNNGSSNASIIIHGKDGTSSLQTSGNWPWLRMTHLGVLKTTSDANQFFLSFKIENYQIQFGLIAKNKQNAYLPGVLTAFRCPEGF